MPRQLRWRVYSGLIFQASNFPVIFILWNEALFLKKWNGPNMLFCKTDRNLVYSYVIISMVTVVENRYLLLQQTPHIDPEKICAYNLKTKQKYVLQLSEDIKFSGYQVINSPRNQRYRDSNHGRMTIGKCTIFGPDRMCGSSSLASLSFLLAFRSLNAWRTI